MEYVWAVSDGLVLNNVQGGTVTLRRGDAWFADDPFVQSRLDVFSATPVVVHSTIGRQAPLPTPVVVEPRRGRGRA